MSGVKGMKRTGPPRKYKPRSELTKIRLRAEKKAKLAGMEPLDFMLQVMRDPRTSKKRRDDMAKAAAPFRHPRLVTSKIVGPNLAEGDQPLSHRFEIVLVSSDGTGTPKQIASQATNGSEEGMKRAIESAVHTAAINASEDDG